MARVTVEDCVDKVSNRFELVMLASHRAREISAGSAITVDRDNDKNPVVALREIARIGGFLVHTHLPAIGIGRTTGRNTFRDDFARRVFAQMNHLRAAIDLLLIV